MDNPVLYLEIARGQRRHAAGPRYSWFESSNWLPWLPWTWQPRDYYIAGLILEVLALYLLYHTTSPAGLRIILSIYAGGDAFGRFCLNALCLQHFFLAILVTIISLTSAFSVEKSRGILDGLLASNLTPAEIVIGKFVARIGQIGWLLLCGLPVLCFIGLPGGLNLAMADAPAKANVHALVDVEHSFQ